MPDLFPEPYAVDPDDRAARGRLLHAAARSDKRARLTLSKIPKQEVEATTPIAGAVQTGRDLFRAKSGGEK